VDTQTRHALKGDKFAQATKTSVTWLSGHRTGVLRWTIGIAVVVLLGVALVVFWNLRASAADSALGAAVDTYSTPLAEPGVPAEKGIYARSSERAKVANQQFQAVAEQYGWLPAGTKAHYFAGVTARELGQNATAEAELKKAADSWDRNISNLAKLALANLYHQTNRDAQAIDMYNAIIAKPSDTVSAGVAQLGLADLYQASGKKDQARALWAKLKDSDKDGTAGSIAAQKLAGGQ
jgi:tetratricopeptide (TPR) repeat protein